MSIDLKGLAGSMPGVDPTGKGAQPAPAPPESGSFRRLLERLETLQDAGSKFASTPPEKGLEEFARAMREVERDHAAMQEMREQLLSAWRSRTT